VAELAGKKVLVKHKTAARNKVRTRAGLNRARKAEMSSAASGNSPPVKTSGVRLKASGSAKAKAKPNEAKTGRSRKAGNETRNVSRANANSGTNNSRANGNKTGVTSNSRGNESATEINNSRVSVNRAVINSGANVRAKGTSSSKASVRANATSSKASAMDSKVARLAPRHSRPNSAPAFGKP
jgi:hypothetical protein